MDLPRCRRVVQATRFRAGRMAASAPAARPGVVVARHRHRGEVHAFNLAGHRQIDGRDEVIGPGGYVYEPAGNVDSWACVGTEDCVVSIIVAGAMDYLDDDDRVIASDDTASLRATYLRWCEATGTEPDRRLDITPHRVR